MRDGTRIVSEGRSPTIDRPAWPRAQGIQTIVDPRAGAFPTRDRDTRARVRGEPTNSDAASPVPSSRAAPLLKQLGELRESSDFSGRHGDRRGETRFVLSPDRAHSRF